MKLISILGGDIWNDRGTWRSNGLDGPGDAYGGVTLDRFRIVAGAYLYQSSFPHGAATLIAQGGCADPTRPSVASVLRKELVELGISPESIICEENSNSSYSQLVELQKMVVQERSNSIAIVSNEWHLPRLNAMLDTLKELSLLQGLHPELVPAEEVLVREHPEEWSDIIDAVRVRSDVLARIEKEQQGVRQILAGTYVFR